MKTSAVLLSEEDLRYLIYAVETYGTEGERWYNADTNNKLIRSLVVALAALYQTSPNTP